MGHSAAVGELGWNPCPVWLLASHFNSQILSVLTYEVGTRPSLAGGLGHPLNENSKSILQSHTIGIQQCSPVHSFIRLFINPLLRDHRSTLSELLRIHNILLSAVHKIIFECEVFQMNSALWCGDVHHTVKCRGPHWQALGSELSKYPRVLGHRSELHSPPSWWVKTGQRQL